MDNKRWVGKHRKKKLSEDIELTIVSSQNNRPFQGPEQSCP